MVVVMVVVYWRFRDGGFVVVWLCGGVGVVVVWWW